MKSTYTLLFMVCCLLLPATVANGQGWQWLKGSATNHNSEESVVVADKLGNAYSIFEDMGGYTPFAFDTITALHPIVVKTDSAGHFVWALQNIDNAHLYSIHCDDNNNLYIFGFYSISTTIGSITLTSPYVPPASYASMYFMAKLSPEGTVLWATNISPVTPFIYSGFSYNYFSLDKYGDAYIASYINKPYTVTIGSITLTNTDTSGSTSDVFIAKFDPSGHPVWAKSIGGAGTDYLFASTATPDGSLYISGNYSADTFKIGGSQLLATSMFTTWFSVAPLRGAYLAKFASDGSLLWAHNVDHREYINYMVTDANENLYVTGFVDSTVAFGSTTLATDPGSFSPFIGRYNGDGSPKWAANSPHAGPNSSFTDQGYGLALDACGNLWACGSMSGTITFGGHTLGTPPVYYDPTYMVEYDTAGNYENGLSIGAGGDDAMGISVDNKGSFYLAGDYWVEDLIINNDTLAGDISNERFFVAKYKYQTSLCAGEIALGVEPVSNIPADEYSLYPDPAQKEITITAGHKLSSILITNLLGKTIYRQDCNTDKTTIDIANIPNGVYLVRIDNKVTKRFVKE